MIIVTVKYETLPGCREKVLELTKKAEAVTRQETGNIEYRQLPSQDNNTEMIVLEKWATLADFHAHMKDPQYLIFKEKRAQYLTGPLQFNVYEATEISME